MKKNLFNENRNSNIWKHDEKNFSEEIKYFINKNEKIYILASFTYITPNYSLLFSLEELKRIIEDNFQVYFIFWDLSIFANPYMEKNLSLGRIDKKEEYVSNKITEFKKIAISVGFNEEQIRVYRSSELWRRMVSYKEKDLFQEFFSLISKLKIKNFSELKKISNPVKFSLDLFFSIHLNKLFPEDLSQEIDLFFLEKDRVKTYSLIRQKLIEEGHISIKKPLFWVMDHFPSLLYQKHVPEWNMNLKDIKNIINNCELKENDLKAINKNIFLSKDEDIGDVPMDNELISKSLYSYLKEKKTEYELVLNSFDRSFVSFKTKEKIKQISQVLKSDIGLEIILLSDGTKNTTSISKILKKSVPTISTYANKLKSAGFIRSLKNGNLKRNFQGIKINFDLGIEDVA